MSSAEERTRLRQTFKRARAEVRDPEQRAEAITQHLLSVLDPLLEEAIVIAAYKAMPGEASLEPLFQARPNQVWGLPRTSEERAMTFHKWSLGEPLEQGEYGILVPAHNAPMVVCSAVLVPLVAFDDHGTRLGMGGGYYDRYLSQLPHGTPKIGIAYDCQRSDTALPKEDWDVTLSKVVTESGVLELA